MNKKRDLRGVRVHNRRVVLDAIRNVGKTTRVDLARRTGLCPATIGFLVDDLLRWKLICESGKQKSNTGRKATIIELDRAHWRFVCIDLWHKVLRVMATDLSCTIIDREEIPLRNRLMPAQVMRHISRGMGRIKDRVGGELAAIGVSVEGAVHPWTGAVTSWMWLRGKQFHVRRCLKERYDVPVLVENVDRIKAWAELGRNPEQAQNIVCFSISTGIGAGVVTKGEIYRGAAAAGDIAHTRIAKTGPRCTLGHRGCLEGFASEKAILREVGRLVHKRIHPGDIDDLCKSNPRVVKLLEEKAEIVSTALAYMVGSLHPGLLILTGPLFQQSETFFGMVRSGVMERAPLRKWRWPKVRRGTLGGGQSRAGMADLLWRAFCDGEFDGGA